MQAGVAQEPARQGSLSKDSDDLAKPESHLKVLRPTDDSQRLESLQEFSPDTRLDPKFEDITRLMCTIFNVPIAAVTLIDRERVFFKSLLGMEYANNQMDREEACFCSWTVAQKGNEVLVVEDATQDARCSTIVFCFCPFDGTTSSQN